MNGARKSAAVAVILMVAVAAVSTTISFSTAHEEDQLAEQEQQQPGKQAKKKKGARKNAAPLRRLPETAVSLTLTLGVGDKQPVSWDGTATLSEGKVLGIDLIRFGGAMRRVEGNRFFVRSVQPPAKQNEPIRSPVLAIHVDAPAGAKMLVNTAQGEFSFVLSNLPPGAKQEFLEGRVRVERDEASLRLTEPETEDDFPALAAGKDGTIWLAYVEFEPSEPVLPERIISGNFDLLVPSGQGDRIRLRRFDGQHWQPPLDATPPGLDIWRPTVSVDGQGRVWVAWSEQKQGNWDIYYRRYTPQGSEWSTVERLTSDPGSDFHVVSTTDSMGKVWLAWQAWRKDNFDCLAACMSDAPAGGAPQVLQVATTPANDWAPSIAADLKGNVYVAWDTYDTGNYDVRLSRLGQAVETRAVASSARFEARPSIVCDAANRVWIAYEEGEEQWGKDYSTQDFRKIPFDRNPGSALYTSRTVRVKCVDQDATLLPAADLEKAWTPVLSRNKSIPRLALDSSGGLWLCLRHHPLPTGAGEVWDSFATRFDGAAWSAPRHLPHSGNLLDNRPALVASGTGLLAVYSGDNRTNTQTRGQDDLFAVTFPGPDKPIPDKAGPDKARADNPPAPHLVPDRAPPAAELKPVHANEMQDLQRIRSYRVEAGGRTLQLVRGEFHRHTEYSAHRDGDGMLEDAWRYALDAGSLDWMGDGDHDNGFHHEYMWWQIQKITDLYHNAPRFVSVQSYERSNPYPNGHRNVIMPRRGIRPLIRGDLKGTPEQGTPDTKLLYAYLKHFGGMCASHTSGTSMGTDWRDNDSEVEPVVEIYQGHRHNYEHSGAPRSATKATQIGGYEPAGYVWHALEKGYRLGFQSSSDHISTHISFAVVLTDDFSRAGLIGAFKQRHCYAATDNIVLDIRCGEHLMGDIFESAERPSLAIRIEGTGPIAKLDVIRDNKYVYAAQPNEQKVDLRYTDVEIQPGQTCYYYVRVQQADGNLAWASPMWITFKP